MLLLLLLLLLLLFLLLLLLLFLLLLLLLLLLLMLLLLPPPHIRFLTRNLFSAVAVFSRARIFASSLNLAVLTSGLCSPLT